MKAKWSGHARASAIVGSLFTTAVMAAQMSGAIFTTTVDGTRVNANLYERKADVYLDGGPGPNAPARAAGLPEGDYFFQVTDPSGKDLLSEDHISCRRIHIGSNGLIDFVYSGTNYFRSRGAWMPGLCQHQSGLDVDHGALTVQLIPYANTPNTGGVYKVWITPVDEYAGNPNLFPVTNQDLVNGEAWAPGNAHGFIPASSKTDNFKVRQKVQPFTPPSITMRKFEDTNGNGIWDAGEPEIGAQIFVGTDGEYADAATGGGWPVDLTEPLGVTNRFYTAATVQVGIGGTFVVEEALLAGWAQTAALRDGTAIDPLSSRVEVPVAGTSGERHDVVFGNFKCFDITGNKREDISGDGSAAGDPAVSGWPIELLRNGIVVANTTTQADGAYSFSVCQSGSYQVREGMLPGWTATAPTTSVTFDGVSGSTYGPFDFLNFKCWGVTGHKYEDTNGNGALDAGEPFIAGWGISLLKGTTVVARTTTNAQGVYNFEVCEAGSFAVKEEKRAGWKNTTPVKVSFTATSGSTRNIDFLNFQCSQLSVTKFYDANRDGIFGGTKECVLQGWNFSVLAGGATSALMTGYDGVAFMDVCSTGTIVVTEENRSGWIHTTPGQVQFEAQSGDNRNLMFGNVKPFLGSLTIGYWKSHTGCANTGTPVDAMYSSNGTRCSTEQLNGGPVTLGQGTAGASVTINNAQQAYAVFNSATCSGTCEYMLKAQLLGAKLNVRRFPGFSDALLGNSTVGEIIAAADAALAARNTLVYKSLAGKLDRANNNHNGTTLVTDGCTPIVMEGQAANRAAEPIMVSCAVSGGAARTFSWGSLVIGLVALLRRRRNLN